MLLHWGVSFLPKLVLHTTMKLGTQRQQQHILHVQHLQMLKPVVLNSLRLLSVFVTTTILILCRHDVFIPADDDAVIREIFLRNAFKAMIQCPTL